MLTARLPTAARTVGDLLARAGRARATGEIVVVEREAKGEGARHRVVLRDGVVVGARVAGRFDPLLGRLLSSGEIDEDGFVAILEAMTATDRPSGELAIDVAGASADAVRDALTRQAGERVAVLLHRARDRARAAWLELGAVEARRHDPALAWHHVVRGSPRAQSTRSPAWRASPPPAAAVTTARDAARRELRRLARTLHPDLHAHLPALERETRAAELAQATARYHSL